MKKKNVLKCLPYYFLMGLFLVGGETLSYGAEAGLGGRSGSEPSFLPVSDAGGPQEAIEAQALRDGHEFVKYDEKALGNTKKLGLEGATGSQPSVLPAPRGGEAGPATASEDWASVVGEKSVPKVEAALGDTGKPGLGGETGSQPRFIPAPQEGGATAIMNETRKSRK